MALPQQFARRMYIRAEQVGDSAQRIVRKTALAIDQTVVLATPVDTGRARSNWMVSLGSPARSVIPPYAPGSKLGVGETANAQAALAQGKETIDRRTDQDIYISNNVHYIGKLNQGSSAQAPEMFVERAIAAGVHAITGEKLLKGP
jgi:hypothetical protein